MQEKLIVKGARQHNLKNINVEIPRNKLVVITGLSGSGKSSLAFDTIYAEGQRRFLLPLLNGFHTASECLRHVAASQKSQPRYAASLGICLNPDLRKPVIDKKQLHQQWRISTDFNINSYDSLYYRYLIV